MMELAVSCGPSQREPSDHRNGAPAQRETEGHAQNYREMAHRNAANSALRAGDCLDLLLIAAPGPRQVKADQHKAG